MLCRMCGAEFILKGNSVTCSKQCSLENKRQNRRRSWHRIGKYTDDKYQRYIKQRLRRIAKRINDVQSIR